MKKSFLELNEMYQKLYTNINDTLNSILKSNDTTIVYELDQQSIDEGSYDYYVDAYDNHGSTYELSIERVQANGEVYGYVNDLGTYWTVYPSDLHNVLDKLTIIEILESNIK
jgi:hypothetical protein